MKVKVVKICTDGGEFFYTNLLPGDETLHKWFEEGYQLSVVEMNDSEYRRLAATVKTQKFFASQK